MLFCHAVREGPPVIHADTWGVDPSSEGVLTIPVCSTRRFGIEPCEQDTSREKNNITKLDIIMTTQRAQGAQQAQQATSAAGAAATTGTASGHSGSA